MIFCVKNRDYDSKNTDLIVKNTFFDTKICIMKIMI